MALCWRFPRRRWMDWRSFPVHEQPSDSNTRNAHRLGASGRLRSSFDTSQTDACPPALDRRPQPHRANQSVRFVTTPRKNRTRHASSRRGEASAEPLRRLLMRRCIRILPRQKSRKLRIARLLRLGHHRIVESGDELEIPVVLAGLTRGLPSLHVASREETAQIIFIWGFASRLKITHVFQRPCCQVGRQLSGRRLDGLDRRWNPMENHLLDALPPTLIRGRQPPPFSKCFGITHSLRRRHGDTL